jgi:glycosyltransferase involved in cell wall biosynthesis
MHILLIHQVFVRPSDAGGTRHSEFARYLAAQGHRVTILAGDRSYLTGKSLQAPRREELQPGVEIIRCGVRGGGGRSWTSRGAGFLSFMLTAFWAGLRVPGIDLVWGTSPPLPQAVAAWGVARLRRVPWVFEVRDLWPEFAIAVGALRNPIWIWLARAWESFLYRHADRLILNSPGFVDPVLAQGALRSAIVSIPNGADPGMFDPTSDGGEVRVRLGLEGKFVALYAGAHGVSNDLGIVLGAAELLLTEPGIAFVLVGDGREKGALVRDAMQRSLTNVIFAEAVAKEKMPPVLAAADCGIAILKPLPAYRTTYPNKVFDYMAAGRPVVLAIEGPIREVVEQARAGFAVHPGDPVALAEAVRRLAADRAAAREMGRRGRSYVEAHFDRSVLARSLEETLRAVARG